MLLNIPKPLNDLVTFMIEIKKYILVVFSLIVSLVFFFVVILRYWFQADLFAYEEWVLMFAFWVYFLGGAVGTHENTHVKADFLLSIVDNPHTKWIITNCIHCTEFIICVFLVYFGWLTLQEEIVLYPDWQRTSGLQLPFFIPKLGIFVGFLLMCFYSLLHLYSGIRTGSPIKK
jgi:TRAP-type C4-dicarboxylate transport system permease small subunit